MPGPISKTREFGRKYCFAYLLNSRLLLPCILFLSDRHRVVGSFNGQAQQFHRPGERSGFQVTVIVNVLQGPSGNVPAQVGVLQ